MAEQAYGITDTGRERSNNEDAFVTLRAANDGVLAAVIDGVGGYEGGEVAAAIARDETEKLVGQPVDTTALRALFLRIQERIVQRKQAQPDLVQMACVMTAVVTDVANRTLHYAHVGDTRLYLYRDGTLVKLTQDHSFVGLLEDSGRITEEEAMTHLKRNEVDRALGFTAAIADPVQYIETGSSPYLPGDLLLLCSDGLTDLVPKAEMTRLLETDGTLRQRAQALVDAANTRGGKDNITVVLVMQEGAPATKRPVGQPRSTMVQEPVVAPERRLEPPLPAGRAPLPRWPWIAALLLAGLAGWWFFSRRTAEPVAVVPQPVLPTLAEAIAQTPDTLLLQQIAAGDTVRLPSVLTIDRDSLVLRGGGATLLLPTDTQSVLEVAPSVHLLTLSRMTLQQTLIRISSANIGALRFDSVRLRRVSIGFDQPVYFEDSVVSGVLYRDIEKRRTRR